MEIPSDIWREIILLCDELSLMRMQQVCRFFRDEIERLPIKHDINYCCKSRLYVQINKILRNSDWRRVISEIDVVRSGSCAIVNYIISEMRGGRDWAYHCYGIACLIGNLDIVKSLQSKLTNSEYYTSGLMHACRGKHIHIMEYIIGEVERLGLPESIKWDIVMMEIEDPQILPLVVKCIDKYSGNSWGRILRSACVNRNIPQLTYLINHVDRKWIKREFRHQCEYGNSDMRDLMIDKINVRNELKWAADHGCTEMEDYLRQYIDVHDMFS